MNRLRELREKKEISQRVLAEKTGISFNCIAGYEKGTVQPTSDRLIWLSEFYNVSIDYLLGRNPVNSNDKLMQENTSLKKELERIRNEINSVLKMERLK